MDGFLSREATSCHVETDKTLDARHMIIGDCEISASGASEGKRALTLFPLFGAFEEWGENQSIHAMSAE